MKKFTRTDTVVTTVGGRFKRDVVLKRFKTEDGITHEFTTWLEEGGRAACAIALTKNREAITLYQFRPGPERWMFDMPGGGVKPGEEPEAGMRRELKEETGYEPSQVEFLGTSSRDAYINCTWYYYLATDCELSEGGPQQDKEEQEQGAELRLISIDELLEYAKHDQMTDPAAVLMAYEKLKEIAAHG